MDWRLEWWSIVDDDDEALLGSHLFLCSDVERKERWHRRSVTER